MRGTNRILRAQGNDAVSPTPRASILNPARLSKAGKRVFGVGAHKVLSVVLSVALVAGGAPVVAQADPATSLEESAGSQVVADVPDANAATPEATAPDVPAASDTPGADAADTPAAADPVPSQVEAPGGLYQQGSICIYSYEQLKLIGSGQALTNTDAARDQVGSGVATVTPEGDALAYTLSASYRLMNDIVFPAGQTWQLPADFSGEFVSAEQLDQPVLYNENTGTVYVYNPYQLEMLTRTDAAEQPVLTFDWDAARFGMGQPITSPGGGGSQL